MISDPTGNWSGYVQKASGTTVLDQDRDHNKVNEIDVDEDHSNTPGASITAGTGTNWYDPSYDAAGNMTGVPKASSLADGLTCKYDAWNRLVEVAVHPVVTFRYEYDGLNRRTVTVRYITGYPSNYNHRYHNASWQVVETRVYDSGGQPETAPPWFQYVWSARYIDSPVLRGQPPSRQWLIYAHAPRGRHKKVKITVPDYRAVSLDVSVAGSFYLVDEKLGSATPVK